MDAFELNKYFGAVVGALLAFVAIDVVVGGAYAPKTHHAHGDEPKLAFAMPIETDEPEPAAEEEKEPEGEPLPVLLASASADGGEDIWNKGCRACHQIGEGAKNGVGPMLTGVLGRDIGAIDGFRYSDALLGKDGDWTWEALNAFLKAPKDWAPGTKMNYRGLRKEEDRATLMLWINAQSPSPIDLPAVDAPADDAPADDAPASDG